MAERAPLPAFLEMTSEKATAIQKEQERLRALSNVPARMSPQDTRRRYALERENAIRGNIGALERGGHGQDSPDMIHAREQLAEVLFEQGRYREALDEVQTEDRRAEIVRYLIALDEEDEKRCECGTKNEYAEKIALLPDGQTRTARRCAKCGFTNLIPGS